MITERFYYDERALAQAVGRATGGTVFMGAGPSRYYVAVTRSTAADMGSARNVAVAVQIGYMAAKRGAA